MDARHGSLTVTAVARDLEISNGSVQIRFVFRDGGYAQEFSAAGTDGRFHLVLSSIHKNLIMSSEHRACASPMISGERPHLFGVCRESLRMVYSDVDVVCHDEEKIVVRLSGSAQGHCVKCEITLREGSNAVHVATEDKMAQSGSDPVVEYLMSSYAFLPRGRMVSTCEQLDYVWAPNLRPANDHVIGDRAFHSPALIVKQGPIAAALVADLDILDGNREIPASLDLDIDNGMLSTPLLSYGFCGYEQTDGGRYCRHDITMARRLHTDRLVYGHYLILSAKCSKMGARRQTARFMWEKLRNRNPEAGPRRKRREQSGISNIESKDVWAAYGLHAFAVEHGDDELVRRARQMRDEALSSPQDKGLFSTRFDHEKGQWSGCRAGIDGGYYSTVECSLQLYWLLVWNEGGEMDSVALRYCRKYADYLIATRSTTGAIPSWYTKDHVPVSALRSSAQTAASVVFLAELAKITGLKKYVAAADRSGRFLLKEIVPGDLFVDYTCLDRAGNCTLECADPHTGARPQGAWAMLWTARSFLALHKLTGNRDYLEEGIGVLDQLCMLQSVREGDWDVESCRFGACVAGNVGSVYDAELTAEFGRCAMSYGALTGENEYFERGVAAMQAAMDRPGAGGESRARIIASARAAQAAFGSAYVHVGKKWGAQLVGGRLRRLDIRRGAIEVDLTPYRNGGAQKRVVFGGLRGNAYRVRIDGRWARCTRERMERGISVLGPPGSSG